MIRKNNNSILLLFVSILVILVASCNPAKKLDKEETDSITDYLNRNSNLNFVLKPSGLYYLEVVEGSGVIPVKNDTAYIKYTGKLLDGTVFDSNIETTDTLIIPVDEGWLISGVDEGITYMREGGKSLLLIPSKLAYGPTGYYYIPGYTPLLFDLELVRVKPGAGK
ncbi:MAG TPA: FKBP-type peptidyl-prolyl cis-trans isomerase [Anaerovoracaceae bacterium]|nr:FKBP-type peptidyl-prolyl cis-trans isomerase [Anaerovoracaceae bacterium]